MADLLRKMMDYSSFQKEKFIEAIEYALRAKDKDGTKWKELEKMFSNVGLRGNGALNNGGGADRRSRIRQLGTSKKQEGQTSSGNPTHSVLVFAQKSIEELNKDNSDYLRKAIEEIKEENSLLQSCLILSADSEGGPIKLKTIFLLSADEDEISKIYLNWWPDLKSEKISIGNPKLPNDAVSQTASIELPSRDEYGVKDILDEGFFGSKDILERCINFLKIEKNIILQGPPGTGKTWLAKRLGMALIGQVVQEPQLRCVQFHPNLSYEDFVRGWRPSSDGGLSLHEGIFMQMVKVALANPDQTYVLVIEEINRGNPAQIFGELLTLLEAGKRTPRDGMQLSYQDPDGSRQQVYVPENLAVIGTMNIADRSLALVDMAFRRRFAFINLEPCLNETWREWVVSKLQMDPVAASEIQQRLNKLNIAIASDSRLGKAFQIGHSYVTPTQSLEGRSSRDWFAEVVASKLKPLLEEYWFDSSEEAEQQANALLEGW